MDNIAAQHEERADLVRETAARRGLAPSLIEKDFWVCWTLQKLFVQDEGHPSLLFKGGTSLSKVFKLIERFSEDIDLSLDRHDLGFKDDRDPMNAPSNKRARKLVEELKATAEEHISVHLLPRLRQQFKDVLGDKRGWSLEIDPSDAQTVLFAYPRPASGNEDLPALPVVPAVRLEFGARSDHWPAKNYPVQPYAADEFPDQFTRPACKVKTLEAERTFWEKATLLHMEYHRPKPRVGRLSRHYYDLAALAGNEGIRDSALSNLELLSHVAEHKRSFYYMAWAKYDEAKPGSLRIVPHEDLHAALQEDYKKMREMFFDEPPQFDQIISVLRELEEEINSLS
jgi:hypothetical protein